MFIQEDERRQSVPAVVLKILLDALRDFFLRN